MSDPRLAHLPVTVQFWDGSVLRADPSPDDRSPESRPSSVVVARDQRALAHLIHEPGELGLARAWVDGSLTATGDLEEVLAVRNWFADVRMSLRDRVALAVAAARAAGLAVLRRPAVPSIEASVSGRRHSLARDRSAVRHHYDVSNEYYRLVLGPTMVYSCAYFQASATVSRRPRSASST
jgi:cyclopropane-fatty-acyl-phospholipid synthase